MRARSREKELLSSTMMLELFIRNHCPDLDLDAFNELMDFYESFLCMVSFFSQTAGAQEKVFSTANWKTPSGKAWNVPFVHRNIFSK